MRIFSSIVVMLLAALTVTSSVQSASALETPELQDIFIGIIAPNSGGAKSYGQDISTASALAIHDFNERLRELGKTWKLVPIYMDSMTNQATIMPTLEYLNGLGVKVVAGPSIDIIDVGADVPFADKNDMLLVSCCSVTLSGAIMNDNLYRMTPNQTNFGHVLASVMLQNDIDAVVSMGRNAPWITDILYAAAESFREAGGQASEPVLYDSYAEFGEQQLSEITRIVELYEAAGYQTAILYVGFEETFDVIEVAAAYGSLVDVRWFGADANTIQHKHMLDDASAMRFTSVQPIIRTEKEGVSLAERLTDHLGRVPSVYAFQQYDAVWLIGEAVLKSGGTDIDALKKFMSLSSHRGIGGPVTFDAYGDRVASEYGVWEIEDDQWVVTDIYGTQDAETDCWGIINGQPLLTLHYIIHQIERTSMDVFARTCGMISIP